MKVLRARGELVVLVIENGLRLRVFTGLGTVNMKDNDGNTARIGL